MRFESCPGSHLGNGMLYQIDSDGDYIPIGEVVDGQIDVTEADDDYMESATLAFQRLYEAITMEITMATEAFEEFKRFFIDPFIEWMRMKAAFQKLEEELEGLYPKPTPPNEYARLRTTSKKGVYTHGAKQSIRQAKAHSYQKVLRNHPYQRRLYR